MSFPLQSNTIVGCFRENGFSFPWGGGMWEWCVGYGEDSPALVHNSASNGTSGMEIRAISSRTVRSGRCQLSRTQRDAQLVPPACYFNSAGSAGSFSCSHELAAAPLAPSCTYSAAWGLEQAENPGAGAREQGPILGSIKN